MYRVRSESRVSDADSFDTDPIQYIRLNTVPIRIRIQSDPIRIRIQYGSRVFKTKNWRKKFTGEKKLKFFDQKLQSTYP